MTLTTDEKMMYIAILAVLMVFVLYFELRVMKKKSKEVQLASMRKDEAYNAIHTCRAVMNVVERQGSNVSESKSLLEKARRAMDRGDYDLTISLCEKTREELTKARTRPTPLPEPDYHRGEKDHLEEVAEQIVKTPRASSSGTEYTGTKLEAQSGPSYLAAKFEINTAKGEIQKAAKKGSSTSQANKLISEATREFDSGNYTKALSLAVRAKKAVLTEADTIPLRSNEPASPMIEADADGTVCHSCGVVMSGDDEFCGKCGTKRPKVRICQSCGREATGDDRFCRKCGFRIG